MAAIVFLFDEDVPAYLADEVIRLEPAIDLLQVGQPSAPPKGTPDSELLLFAEQHQQTLVSGDKRTLPGHLQQHFDAGRHTWGVFLLLPGYAPVRHAEDLVLIWSTMKPEDLVDWQDYLPW